MGKIENLGQSALLHCAELRIFFALFKSCTATGRYQAILKIHFTIIAQIKIKNL